MKGSGFIEYHGDRIPVRYNISVKLIANRRETTGQIFFDPEFWGNLFKTGNGAQLVLEDGRHAEVAIGSAAPDDMSFPVTINTAFS